MAAVDSSLCSRLRVERIGRDILSNNLLAVEINDGTIVAPQEQEQSTKSIRLADTVIKKPPNGLATRFDQGFNCDTRDLSQKYNDRNKAKRAERSAKQIAK